MMQPPKLGHRKTWGCAICGRYYNGREVIFAIGSRCLCLGCYLNYVEQRASELAARQEVSEGIAREKVVTIIDCTGHVEKSASEKGELARLRTISQIQQLRYVEAYQETIAEDLRISTKELFPRDSNNMLGDVDRKEAIIADVLRVRSAYGKKLRASFLAQAIYLGLGVLFFVMIYRVWR